MLLAAFFLAVLLIAAQACWHTGKEVQASYHAFLQTEAYRQMPRAGQVKQCASCHPKEYENEQNGPHANAYAELLKHRDFVNSDRYRCAFYTTRVNRDFEDCVGCHAPENLLQTQFYDSSGDMGHVYRRLNQRPVPDKRQGEAARMPGVDCLSCHYDGEKISALKNPPSPYDTAAHQPFLAILRNNLNCFPCHMQSVRSFNAGISIKQTGSAFCVNCHQQYVNGKGTHYYYWQHGPDSLENPDLLSLLDDFRYVPVNARRGEIHWLNTRIPHDISSGPELIIGCEILDKNERVLGQTTVRINAKKHFDEEMYPVMGNNYLYGTLGDLVPLDGKTRTYPFSLNHAERAHALKLSLYHKAQYWFPDSLGVLKAIKTKPL